MDKQKIKIFVSRRRDVNSFRIPNEIYVNVDCGAIYSAKHNKKVNGDDSGDNISYKAPILSELTVQYWAWKNYNLDYYGLCHYRRFLSFSDNRWPIDDRGHVVIEKLTRKTASHFGLLNNQKMLEEIPKFDMIYAERIPVKMIKTLEGNKENVLDMWMANEDLIPNKILTRLIELIKQMAPDYSDSLDLYLKSEYHIGYCCYVMKSELFNELCDLQYPILNQLESEMNMTQYAGKQKRCLGFAGEIMYGLFVFHQHYSKKRNCKEAQLIFFEQTTNTNYLKKVRNYLQHVSYQLDSISSSLNKMEGDYDEIVQLLRESKNKKQ